MWLAVRGQSPGFLFAGNRGINTPSVIVPFCDGFCATPVTRSMRTVVVAPGTWSFDVGGGDGGCQQRKRPGLWLAEDGTYPLWCHRLLFLVFNTGTTTSGTFVVLGV